MKRFTLFNSKLKNQNDQIQKFLIFLKSTEDGVIFLMFLWEKSFRQPKQENWDQQ